MKLEMIVAALAALALAPVDAAASCAFSAPSPEVLTTPDAKLASDGGVLVGWHMSTTPEQGSGDPSAQSTWTATADGKPVTLAQTPLAPGLTLYKPAKPITGKLALLDAKGTSRATATFDGKAAALDAPKVTRIARVSAPSFRSTTLTYTAAVDSVPDGAVALVMSTTGDHAHAATFGRPAHDKTGATSVVVYEAGGHCGGGLGLQEALAAGTKVTFAWVDASGHVSPASAAISIK